ncbi:2-succinyl-5-enolpyruvyl-6-hydroxy-3-cyclohexene-1-carboxylic-acid synthase [Salimicrobium flavidum]|uniref:2-succinyl-5-enolpyruvyl-6-hydroxy-3-cyclohexene-1-carboxylate synthase n=1 Tax=Salimicrobium flavidum TaxID=570947 RepID=A0A1N7J3Y9_9BACI|nr:2-succinyl-5-enolpyruvyl-6-hydroxy-3-cyclohexene-1-carboxylic-acid synthase [Salimicrobium flavidum]SIS44019.1 2-succinyl-5-enolpyruvyl-6-hydroxy-3-cyclohexene-1-carboxylate synthase [Salimicrobium flavidum]
MSYTEDLSRYVTHFIDQLALSGVSHAVISPGSRSTPLAVTAAESEDITHWVQLDERSAGFFAVGLAKEKQEPVALICTSGTAAANYYPAVIEAYYSRVPLILLTADRPHELRDVGAPQAIDQIDMYGNYTKWFHDMMIPEADREIYARRQAARSVSEALSSQPGPVQLNFPLREPLMPDFTLSGLWRNETTFPPFTRGRRTLDEDQLEYYAKLLRNKEKGLIVCGPQTDPELAGWIGKLAESLDAPVFADPLSQLRGWGSSKDAIITHYDSLLRSDSFNELLREADYVLRFGAMPVSKAYLKWVRRADDTEMFIVDHDVSYRDPSGIPGEFIWTDPVSFCKELIPYVEAPDTSWKNELKLFDETAAEIMFEKGEETLYEGDAVHELASLLEKDSILFVGNSMPIRDVDTFFPVTGNDLSIFANRGANGIDGVTSTAAGLAASGRKVTLLTGDVSFFHDMNGLLAVKQYELDLTVIVINNNGGGIFSYLPQAGQTEHYEALFGTPLDIDLGAAVKMYGGSHRKVKRRDAFTEAVAAAMTEKGLSVVEAVVSREDHVDNHRDKWNRLDERIVKKVGEHVSHRT